MKHVCLWFVFLSATLASAATLHVKFQNGYGKETACAVDQNYNAEFRQLMNSVEPDRTNKRSALTLFEFFSDGTKGTCYKPRSSGDLSIGLPHGHNYVFFLTMTPDGGKVYFKVANYAGDIEQAEVITAP